MTYTNPPHYFNLSVLSLCKMARRRTSNQIYLITFRAESGKIHSITRHLVALSLWTTLQLPLPLRSVFQALLSKAPLMRELCMVLPSLKAVITVFFFLPVFSVFKIVLSRVFCGFWFSEESKFNLSLFMLGRSRSCALF